jgi:cyclohexadienyl dehydratase
MVPRGDVALQQYLDQFSHLYKANGEYQAVVDK